MRAMRKKSKIILSVVILLAVAAALFAHKLYRDRQALIQILDGPGSYVEHVTGWITEITDETEYTYVITLQLDEGSKDYVRWERCRALVERSVHEDGGMFAVGDYVAIAFPGGVNYSGDPVQIDHTYNVYSLDATETEPGAEGTDSTDGVTANEA